MGHLNVRALLERSVEAGTQPGQTNSGSISTAVSVEGLQAPLFPGGEKTGWSDTGEKLVVEASKAEREPGKDRKTCQECG